MGKMLERFLFGKKSDSVVDEIEKAEKAAAEKVAEERLKKELVRKEAELEKARMALSEATVRQQDIDKVLKAAREELQAIKEATLGASETLVATPAAPAVPVPVAPAPVVDQVQPVPVVQPQPQPAGDGSQLPAVDCNALYYNATSKRLMTSKQVMKFREKFAGLGGLSLKAVNKFRAYTASGIVLELTSLPLDMKEFKNGNVYAAVQMGSLLKKSDFLEFSNVIGSSDGFELVSKILAVIDEHNGTSIEVPLF